jgi:hypothetical protein
VLSVRLPPKGEPAKAAAALKKKLEENPPYHADVTFDVAKSMAGWCAPDIQPWLQAAVDEAGKAFSNDQVPLLTGEGGSIPFMSMLADMHPQAQFVITGVLGPASNGVFFFGCLFCFIFCF